MDNNGEWSECEKKKKKRITEYSSTLGMGTRRERASAVRAAAPSENDDGRPAEAAASNASLLERCRLGELAQP